MSSLPARATLAALEAAPAASEGLERVEGEDEAERTEGSSSSSSTSEPVAAALTSCPAKRFERSTTSIGSRLITSCLMKTTRAGAGSEEAAGERKLPPSRIERQSSRGRGDQPEGDEDETAGPWATTMLRGAVQDEEMADSEKLVGVRHEGGDHGWGAPGEERASRVGRTMASESVGSS